VRAANGRLGEEGEQALSADVGHSDVSFKADANQMLRWSERTDPFRSAVPIDPDQLFRLIPISRSD
jgi:hypothetical protein